MGWLYSTAWRSPAEMREHLLHDIATSNRLKVIDSTLTSAKNLWLVLEDAQTGERFIMVALIRGSRAKGYGYKDITESMGPCETDCPLRFLDMVPVVPEPYGAAWRERVRAHHAKAAHKWATGARCTIGGTPYTVVGRRSRTMWLVRNDEGQLFKANTMQMVPVQLDLVAVED